MKKLFLLFAILTCSLIVTAQSKKISEMTPTTSIAGTELIPLVQSGTNKSLTPNVLLSYLNSYLGGFGYYNILNYGATSGGTVEDQTAIQAALDAAYTTKIEEAAGTVIIPAGQWYITAGVEMKSGVTVKCEPGAYFTFPTDYNGTMWKHTSGELNHFTLIGGYYYLYDLDPTWNCIDIKSSNVSSSEVFKNTFRDMYICHVDTAITLKTFGTGWINANVFDNIYIELADVFIYSKEGVSSNGIDGNLFSNMNMQYYSDHTTLGIRLSGSWNSFTNCIMWDWPAYTSGIASMVSISSSSYNTFMGGSLGNGSYLGSLVTDNGVANYFYCQGRIRSTILEYANNDAAISAGLLSGRIYRNGDVMMIVH